MPTPVGRFSDRTTSMPVARSFRSALSSILAVVMAGCSSPLPLATQPVTGPAHAPDRTVVIDLHSYFRGLKTARVSISGVDYAFLLDTAGGRTLLSPELAHEIGCIPRGRGVGYRMTGESVVFKNCERLDASVSGLSLSISPIGVFDLNSLLPSELPRLDGVLALDAFRGQVITLDWARNQLSVRSSADGERALATNGIAVRIATGENGSQLSVLAPVRAGNTPLWFHLDSGNLRGTLVARQLVLDGSIEINQDGTAVRMVGRRHPQRLNVIADDINYDGVFGTEYLQTNVVSVDLRSAP